MRSVTSSFNRTLYHKNLTRFWPIWSLYTLIFVFALPIQVLIQGDSTNYPQSERIREVLWDVARVNAGFVTSSMVFGVLIAMAVFSYLYQSRSACMMHALPISRKSLYLTNYLSGLSMMLIPNLVILVLTLSAAVCRGVWEPMPVLGWFLVQSCSGVFFFSFASFCAMFTGNLFALPVFYGVLNFIVVIIGGLIMPLLSSLLYGFQNYSTRTLDTAYWFTPYIKMSQNEIVNGIRAYDPIKDRWKNVGYELMNLESYVVYLVAGLVIALLGYLVYCRYETERAGDVVAEVRVHTLFRYGVGLCGGLSFGIVTTLLMGFDEGDTTVLMILSVLWGIVAYFVAEMLLQKSFKVMKKAWKGALIFAAMMIVFFVCIAVDVVGYGRTVPNQEDVQSAYIRVGTHWDSYTDDVTDPQVIGQILDLHHAIAKTGRPEVKPSSTTETATTIRINYTLKDGGVMTRYYDVRYFQQEVDAVGTVTQCVNALIHNPAFIDGCQGLGEIENANITYMNVYELWDEEVGDVSRKSITSPEAQMLVFDAVKQDYAQGNWGAVYLFGDETFSAYYDTRYESSLAIEYEYEDYEGIVDSKPGGSYEVVTFSNGIDIELNPNCVNTIEALYQVGVLDDQNRLVTREEMNSLLDKAEDMEKFYD